MFRHPRLYDEQSKTHYVNALGRINTLEVHRQEGYLRVDVRWYSGPEAAGFLKDPTTIASKPIDTWSTTIPTNALTAFLSGGLGALDFPELKEAAAKAAADNKELDPAKIFYLLVAKYDHAGTDGASRYVEQNVGSDEDPLPDEDASPLEQNQENV